MKKHTTFLSAKFSADYKEKHDLPMTEEMIGHTCNCTAQTVINWADPTQGSIMKVTQGKALADLIGISFDEFFKNYIK